MDTNIKNMNKNKKSKNLYKHIQVSYLILFVSLIVLIFFIWIHITALSEVPSVDSGSNFAVSAIMVLILSLLVSFITLTTSIDETYVRIKFGYGIFVRKFPLNQISSVKIVKNHWYYGWGIKIWFWPYMWIYNVAGLDAVEIIMNNKIYRIGTDAPEEFVNAIKQAVAS